MSLTRTTTSETGPFYASGSISFSSLRTNFKKTSSGSIKASEIRRNTSGSETQPIVPDSTENRNSGPLSDGISASNNLKLSQFRNSIKYYDLTQGSDIDLNLNIAASSLWNSNLQYNIEKRVYLSGTSGSTTTSTPAASLNATAVYNVLLIITGVILGDGGSAGTETTNGGNGDGKDNTPITEKSRKKRRVEDVSGLGTLLPSLPPASKLVKPNGGNSISEHMELQRRLVQSKEDTNRAIQLRETVESSAILRTGIREEKDRRVSLFKELVAKLGGDDSQATSRINAYKEAKDNGTIMGEETYDPLIESVAEQDELIAQMTLQHVTLNKEVDRLLPQEKNGEDTSEEIQDSSAVEPEEVLVKV